MDIKLGYLVIRYLYLDLAAPNAIGLVGRGQKKGGFGSCDILSLTNLYSRLSELFSQPCPEFWTFVFLSVLSNVIKNLAMLVSQEPLPLVYRITLDIRPGSSSLNFPQVMSDHPGLTSARILLGWFSQKSPLPSIISHPLIPDPVLWLSVFTFPCYIWSWSNLSLPPSLSLTTSNYCWSLNPS